MAGRTLMHMLLLTAAKLPVVPVSAIKLVTASVVLAGIVCRLEIGGDEGDGSIIGIKLRTLVNERDLENCTTWAVLPSI